jgi:hypothetical protein
MRLRTSGFLRRALLLVPLCLSLALDGASAKQADAPDPYASGFRAFERGDHAEALRLWAPLAERGDPRAQFGLALIHEGGLGGAPKDEEAALGWYRRAARKGLSAAQNNLALMYAEGRVVPRDEALAVTLWREAAQAGHAPAQQNLARALERGAGGERDEREAAEWSERARAQLAGPASGRAALPAPIEPASSAPAPLAGFYVQLASLRRRDDAALASTELARRHADLLAGWQPTVRSVDLAEKGVWHRVWFGPALERAAADALCAKFRTRGAACLVASQRQGGASP